MTLDLAMVVLNMTLRTQAKKLDNLVFVKMKNFCSSKTKIKRVKGDLWNGRKYFANHIYDGMLISRIFKNLL